ncbi:MAG: BrnT family toxin [Cyanobacteria bacterium P01_F01_bin.53]
MLEFEFDNNKSDSNSIKHGISFTEAQQLWDDVRRIEIPARTDREPRFALIGKIEQKVWTAVITYRQSKVRIISVRRARDKEIAAYEEKDN